MTPPNKQPSITDADREAAEEECFEYHGCFTGDCPHQTAKQCALHFFKQGILHERAKVDELVKLLKDSLRTRRFPAPEDAEVMALGKRIGFGALMDSAQKCWRETMEERGLAGSEFTVGHCVGVVENALKQFSGRSG